MNVPILIRRHESGILILAILAVLAIGLSSCDAGPAGIFSRVATEKPINLTMTPALKDSNPSFVARLGEDYYAGIGILRYKKAADTSWSDVGQSVLSEIKATSSTNTKPSPLFASAGAAIGTNLYVLFVDSGTGQGLGVWKTVDGSVWNKVTGLDSAGYVRTLLSANDELFAVTEASKGAYSIYHFDGSGFVATSIVANTSIGYPSSVAHDGSSYWFSAGSKLISGTGELLASENIGDGPVAGGSYAGLCSTTGSGFVVSTRDGYLHYTDNAGVDWKTSDNTSYSLSVPSFIVFDSKQVLVVGTHLKSTVDGYLEFDMADVATSFPSPNSSHTLISDATNFAASLAGKPIRTLSVFDEGSGRLKAFALCDGNNGLWSNTYSATWGGWIRE